ncbi:MAG: hypothetical protein ACO3MI_00730 [Candidatus Poseidoniaceae archaeon]
MGNTSRLLPTLALFLALTILVGSSSGSSSGLFFHHTIEAEDAQPGTRTIELDSQGNIYATFKSILIKYDSEGLILEDHQFASEILATALSPDGSKLAVTTRTSTTGTDSVYVLSTGDLSVLVSNDATSTNANLLEWSPNGANLYTNAPDNGVLQLNKDTLDIETSYVGNHTNLMACIDVSVTSGSVLTADVEGLVHLWNNEGDVVQHEILLGSTILDCQIGDNDEYYSVSTPNNGIRKWTFTGSELKPIDLSGVLRYEYSPLPNTLIVHTDVSMHQIHAYDVANEKITDTISMFHTFDDYHIDFDQNGAMERIHTTSRVKHIVVYDNEVHHDGIGESGIDTDGDGVPDSIDDDDDGDGIEDNWDLNCPDIGISCSLLPDEDYIRNIDIEVNSTHLVVTQFFTLNKLHSASIRDLARYSTDSDIKLSAEEAELFSDAICNNMNAIDVSSSLKSHISVEQYSLNFSEMSCSVEEGMVLYPSSDRISHIRYAIDVVFEYQPTTTDGLVVIIQNHRFMSTGSITELSPQHPLSIHIHGEDITSQEYGPWHIQENQVSFTLADKQIDSSTLDPGSIASSPIIIALILLSVGVLISAGVFFARRQSEQSNYDIVLDEDEDEEEDEDYAYDDEDEYYDDEDEFSANDDDQDDEDDVEDDAPVRRQVPPRRRTASSKRVPVRPNVANEAKQLLQESSNEVVRKRRARQSEHDTVRTKRRKLSDQQPVDAEPRRRRAVKKDPQSEDDMDETLRKFVSESPEE